MRAGRAYIAQQKDVKPSRSLGIEIKHSAAALRAAGKDA